ncbi:MAG TPA: flagellar biosynthesis anti-sigma factor FlgM [Sedimentisphaerales bacterium]|nr:flagellar biosynthesis anti-sigma factor FlgM [Sedimentisphaerales bacterium]HRS11429.1 flagellar biosynthesis anti-sigma factor FlgM [Sedimentisphaerales bacterium]HRV48033.1 flagellar biosynthesis anti-sigma factor FlgM [Sedimentisphaerales bacterium]
MDSFNRQQDMDTGVAVLDMDHQPPIRRQKVREIRRQLRQGRYSVADRLDVVVERLLDVLNR